METKITYIDTSQRHLLREKTTYWYNWVVREWNRKEDEMSQHECFLVINALVEYLLSYYFYAHIREADVKALLIESVIHGIETQYVNLEAIQLPKRVLISRILNDAPVKKLEPLHLNHVMAFHFKYMDCGTDEYVARELKIKQQLVTPYCNRHLQEMIYLFSDLRVLPNLAQIDSPYAQTG